jgi:hypothetical protein
VVDEYVVVVHGDSEKWIPIYSEEDPEVFKGWNVKETGNKYRMSELILEKNGILTTKDGKIICQILAFPYSVTPGGNPMPEKAGFLSVMILETSPILLDQRVNPAVLPTNL